MSDQVKSSVDEQWTNRSERQERRWFVGLQNRLPQSDEDEQWLFAALKERTAEIGDRAADDNMYMLIHDDGAIMTVARRVERIGELPEGMAALELPEEEYELFRFEEKLICSFWAFFCDADNRNRYRLDTVKARYETFNDSLQPNGVTEVYYPKLQGNSGL